MTTKLPIKQEYCRLEVGQAQPSGSALGLDQLGYEFDAYSRPSVTSGGRASGLKCLSQNVSPPRAPQVSEKGEMEAK